MYYITYIKNNRLPEPEQITFDQFYAALRANQEIERNFPDMPEITKPKFGTIVTEELTTTYRQELEIKYNRFIHRFGNRMSNFYDQPKESLYTTFQIPKQSGGMRTINAPVEPFKEFQQDILTFLNHNGFHPHNCAYAYVPKRSIKDAIEVHQKKNHKWFMKIDLHNFFGSCTPRFIFDQLTKIPFFHKCSIPRINQFIGIATLNNGLPQGSPLSPWITNQIMLPIDYQLSQLCHEHNITYTRYADDMLFSANTKNGVKHAKNLVETVLRDTPLTINNEKTRISSIYGQNWNLGLMLNKDNNITVGYKTKERFRATIHHFCANRTEWNRQTCSELLGKLTYYSNIEPEYFANLLTKYGTKYNMNIRDEIIRIIKT